MINEEIEKGKEALEEALKAKGEKEKRLEEIERLCREGMIPAPIYSFLRFLGPKCPRCKNRLTLSKEIPPYLHLTCSTTCGYEYVIDDSECPMGY